LNTRIKSHTISKRERSRLPPRPEFAWTGVLVGLFAGWLTGAALEAAWGKPKILIMLIAGFTGVGLGFVIETVRYLWRVRRFRAHRKN
jgi:hypothetical protein